VKKIALTLALGLSFFVTAVAGTPAQNNGQADSYPITDFLLSNLQNSQTLRVESTSRGCFHNDSDTLEINQRRVKMSKLDSYYPDYILTNAQITAIDKHIYFVGHNGGEGRCTSLEQVKLSIIENGVVVKSNEFSYNWCLYTLDWGNRDSESRAMDFSNLANKIRQLDEEN